MVDKDKLKRWRLILGNSVQEQMEGYGDGSSLLNKEDYLMDEALAAIYDETDGSGEADGKASRHASLGRSSPAVAKWLGDVRSFFPEDVVSVIQQDAIDRKGLTQLLYEPEVLKNVKPDIQMVATLLSLRGKIPERTKDTARELVKAVVEDIKNALKVTLEVQ